MLRDSEGTSRNRKAALGALRELGAAACQVVPLQVATSPG